MTKASPLVCRRRRLYHGDERLSTYAEASVYKESSPCMRGDEGACATGIKDHIRVTYNVITTANYSFAGTVIKP